MKNFVAAGAACVYLLITAVVHAQPTREVTVNARSVVDLNTKVRYTTMVILPEGEEILDIICGDKDFWIVSGAQNFAYIKPAKPGAATNLNLVTATGLVYSFALSEGAVTPDLKVFVVPDRTLKAPAQTQRLHSAAEVDQLRKEIEQVRRASEATREQAEAARDAAIKAADERVTRFRASFPTLMQFPYRFKANAKPFRVSAIYHDGRCTYIQHTAPELPTVYELKDGAASLVNVQVQDGVLVIPKVLEMGYLAAGKDRFFFHSTAK